MCVYHFAQLSYTTQHRTVLIILCLILQTIIIAQMMFSGGGQSLGHSTDGATQAYAWHMHHTVNK